MLNFKNKNKGFSLIELIVAVGIFAVLASGVTYVVSNSYENFYGTGDQQKITEFAQEGLEIARKIKDNSWTYFVANVDANKGVAKNANGVWEFSGSSNVSGSLTRVIYISSVGRDSQSNIVTSGGTDDPLTKKVTVTVSGEGMTDYVIYAYLSNWGDLSWTQTDWSGGLATEFWSSSTRAYSSSNIDNSGTIGVLKLSEDLGSNTWTWDDLTDFASTTGSGTAYDTIVDEGSGHWYWQGSATSLRRLPISNIRSTGFGTAQTLTTAAGRVIALNPVYPHVYTGHNLGVIRTISTTTFSVLKTYTPVTSPGYAYAMVVNSAGTKLFVGGAGGYLFSFSIASDGTLTCQNCDGSGLPQTFSGDVIGAMWLDEANNQLYLATDSATNSLMKVDVTDPKALVAGKYVYSNTVDFTTLSYRGTNDLGRKRFLIGTDYSASLAEFLVIDDDGAKFTKAGQVDLSATAGTTINVKDVFYTNNNEAFVMAVDAATPYVQLFTISGVSTIASPSLAVDLRNYDFFGYSTLSYHPSAYSQTYGGVFVGWTYGGGTTAYSTFFEQQEVAQSNGYFSSGTLVSSKFDLGSADRDLHTLTVNQNVPSGCSLSITFSADDNSSFSSPTTQVFTSTSANYSTAFNANMSGQRWLKYQVDMTNCNSSTETPTLYDLKVNYR